jgi:hypothetical protein
VLPAQKGTRTNPAFGAGEEPFENKAGRRDQGGTRDRGDTAVAGNAHINNRRAGDMGTPARASGRPSKGGGVRNKGGIPRTDQINQASEQRPTFPKGARIAGRASNAAPRAVRGGWQRPSGPMYGGPSSQADG